uniref:ARAD1D22264p n=1 Tax=Blastobotrys adeninivorans TaxID=409370 RepID=A0A060T9W6_BLAAD
MTDYEFADVESELKESFAEISKSIRKESRSVKNRINSIVSDANYVKQVAESYNLPLVANERCGRWYINPRDVSESVYFKSTDGHTSQWSFSLRRLNTHLLPLLGKSNGVVIVDSTRRGKRMPDALAKTVPIWCAVMNGALYGTHYGTLYTPRNAVSESEHSQMEARLPQWIEQLKSMPLDFDKMKNELRSKPIRPIWVTPDGYLPDEPPAFSDFIPVVLCTASRMVQDGTDHRQGYTYVQGAADDHELWAKDLNPDLLWSNVEVLTRLGQSDEQILQLITELHGTQTDSHSGTQSQRIEPTNVFITTAQECANHKDSWDVCIHFAEKPLNLDSPYYMHYKLEPGKKGSKELRNVLPEIMQRFDKLYSPTAKVLLIGAEGDFHIAVATAILCQYYQGADGATALESKSASYISKDEIRKRLALIVTQVKCNPSRATLNSLNSFLMG